MVTSFYWESFYWERIFFKGIVGVIGDIRLTSGGVLRALSEP